jgi:hypothetical protein
MSDLISFLAALPFPAFFALLIVLFLWFSLLLFLLAFCPQLENRLIHIIIAFRSPMKFSKSMKMTPSGKRLHPHKQVGGDEQ